LPFLGTVGELQNELASHHASLEPLFLELTSGNNGNGIKAEGGGRRAEGNWQTAEG
jgi:hypothetical protein